MAASPVNRYSFFFGTCLSLLAMTGCKKNEVYSLYPPPPPPGVVDVTLHTIPPKEITGISAFAGAHLIDSSMPPLISFVYIDLNTSPNFANSITVFPYDGRNDSIFFFIYGLRPLTTYYIRARSDDHRNLGSGNIELIGTTYGDTLSFTTDSIYIGMKVNGGIVFYVDSTGEHGLISMQSDLPDMGWFYSGLDPKRTGATSTTDGSKNTSMIDSTYQYSGINTAAASCSNFTTLSWSDKHVRFFLPSKDQLQKMYLKKDLIGGFSNKAYWSSTEVDDDNASLQDFSNGSQSFADKSIKYGVRAIFQF